MSKQVDEQEKPLDEQSETVDQQEKDQGTEPDATEVEQEEEDPIIALKQEAGEWKDKYMRLHAEFDNFRKRSQRERVELLSSASADVLRQLLPTLDDFDRAIQANASNEDLGLVKEGFELISNKMRNTLKSKGLEPMDAVGKVFDVDNHEAITKIPAPEEGLKGKVVDVIERGYFLNDKVLRYAKVVVGE